MVRALSGGMAERFKAHAWKACWGQPLAGSNPAPSASLGYLHSENNTLGVDVGWFPHVLPHRSWPLGPFGRSVPPQLDQIALVPDSVPAADAPQSLGNPEQSFLWPGLAADSVQADAAVAIAPRALGARLMSCPKIAQPHVIQWSQLAAKRLVPVLFSHAAVVARRWPAGKAGPAVPR